MPAATAKNLDEDNRRKTAALYSTRADPAIYAGEQPQTSHEEISDTNTKNSKCPQINFTEVTF